jgi:hypothetical protein
LDDYEALAPKGRDKIAAALIARHNLRMESIHSAFDDYRFATMSAIAPAGLLDLALLQLGADAARAPSADIGTEVDHLLWGVDSAIAIARLLLSGQVVGAAMLARNQLETWLLRRSNAAGIKQEPGESVIEFFARVWSVPDPLHKEWEEKRITFDLAENDFDVDAQDPETAHLHVFRSDGTEICPPVIYSLLSETVHARESPNALLWDADCLKADPQYEPEVVHAAANVAASIFLSLREIRMATLEIATHRKRRDLVNVLRSGLDSISQGSESGLGLRDDYEAIPFNAIRARETRIPSLSSLAPLLPEEGLHPDLIHNVSRYARDFETILAGGNPVEGRFFDDEFTVRMFAWHRLRSIRTAQSALRHEREQLGPSFNIDSLGGRAARWVLLTEMSSLIALWHESDHLRASAAATASALRSAYWLWLEDDDRSMSVLRAVLEHVARIRCWRLKPGRAAILASSSKATPRDWIELAGWKRLRLLNRVLGEFAHARNMEEWPAWREILSELQLEADPKRALYTARGSTIDFVSELVAREVVLIVDDLSTQVGESFRDLLGARGQDRTGGHSVGASPLGWNVAEIHDRRWSALI